ncbi:MAG: hypothetical protein ABIY37_15025 [Devosia sp.]
MTSNPLTRQKAEAHEALYPALERLTRQLEATAARNPSAPVPPAARAIAADLLFEAQAFGWNRPGRTRRDLPEPAADAGGLATQLGQALALLDTFEAAHSAFHPEHKCFAWLLADPLPVKRLRPQSAAIIRTAKETRDTDHMRQKILARFDEKYEEGYDKGYADASSGHQHRVAQS